MMHLEVNDVFLR